MEVLSDFSTISTFRGCAGPEGLFSAVDTLGGFGGLERTDFCQFSLWQGVVVLKGLILDNFHMALCGGLERMILDDFHFESL